MLANLSSLSVFLYWWSHLTVGSTATHVYLTNGVKNFLSSTGWASKESDILLLRDKEK